MSKYFNGKGSGIALLVLRVVVGLVFIFHGIGKLNGIEGTAGFFDKVGIPFAFFMSWVVALVETLGGLALILGVFTKISTVLLGIVMLVAIFAVKLKNGLTGQGGFELDLVILASLIVLYAQGAGIWTSTCILNKKDNQI